MDADLSAAGLHVAVEPAPGRREPPPGGLRLLAGRAAITAYLFYVAEAIRHDAHGAGAVWGYAILAAFGLCPDPLLVMAPASRAARPGV